MKIGSFCSRNQPAIFDQNRFDHWKFRYIKYFELLPFGRWHKFYMEVIWVDTLLFDHKINSCLIFYNIFLSSFTVYIFFNHFVWYTEYTLSMILNDSNPAKQTRLMHRHETPVCLKTPKKLIGLKAHSQAWIDTFMWLKSKFQGAQTSFNERNKTCPWIRWRHANS